MSQFRTKAQIRASKLKSLQTERIHSVVSARLKAYDAQLVAGQPTNHVARNAFAAEVLKDEKAKANIGVRA